MPKNKLSTPAWILEGKEKPKKEKKKNSFKIKECPKCGSDNVRVILNGEEGKASKEWECKKCNWKGKDIIEKELNEEEFMKYLDEKGEEVA